MDKVSFPLRLDAIEVGGNSILARSRSEESTPVQPMGEIWIERFMKQYLEYQKKSATFP